MSFGRWVVASEDLLGFLEVAMVEVDVGFEGI